MGDTAWGTDGPVSMPVPPKGQKLVTYGGFTFTEYGIAHDVTEADLEEVLGPTYAPSNYIPGTAKGIVE